MKIAFGYKQRVGKDTSCDYLIKKYGGVKLSFAQPLYDILHFAQGICNFTQTKDRKFLQFVGTEWARSINSNVWVDLLLEKVKNIECNTTEPTHIFVSDLRFQNELHALKKQDFICVLIKKEVYENLSSHQSDIDLDNYDDWDYTIENYSSFEHLYNLLDLLFEQIKASDNAEN
jgi:hypothetical protein